MPIPKIRIINNKIPIIYLDTNALIELSRYEKGCCNNTHLNEIGELYYMLLRMMQEQRILCVLGNQLEEMGFGEAREDARNFLFRFTNVEFVPPYQVKERQLIIGYRAFAKKQQQISFSASNIIKEPVLCNNSSVEIRAIPIYSQSKMEVLKQGKEKLAKTLNDVKINGRVEKDYDNQLKLELKADILVFQHNLEHGNDSEQCFMNMLDSLKEVYRRVDINPANASDNDKLRAVDSHNRFLMSSYHHKLPFVWVQSVLFAHVMHRQNKIIPSDNLDIIWAAAYLPFVDYAVTDTSFCKLLNQSGLAELYGTEVYCFKTLKKLLENFHT